MNLKQRIPFLRWSVSRLAVGARNIATTGQIGDGREAAPADYLLSNAREGDINDVLATIDQFAYEKSALINVGDEKGALLDAAVGRADPRLVLELGIYCAPIWCLSRRTSVSRSASPRAGAVAQGQCARGWAPAQTSRSACTVTSV
jgi:catechol O-methyltransferase